MTEQVVVIGIGLAIGAVILWLMIRSRSATTNESPSLTPETSEELAELELDRSMGRVSDDDYARFRDELAAKRPVAPVAAVESPPGDARARAEELVRQWKQAPRPSCAKCGIRPEPEAVFCSNCGARMGA